MPSLNSKCVLVPFLVDVDDGSWVEVARFFSAETAAIARFTSAIFSSKVFFPLTRRSSKKRYFWLSDDNLSISAGAECVSTTFGMSSCRFNAYW